MDNRRNAPASKVTMSIVLAAAILALPAMGFGQDQERAPAPDAGRSKAIRTYRLRIPAYFLKQEAVRFERAYRAEWVDYRGWAQFEPLWSYSAAPRQNLRFKEGARWACGQRAFLALRNLLEGKSITCRFMHVTMPPNTGSH